MRNSNFTFIDLFAGIGGIRKALENVGGRCVFSSEHNKFACTTYYHNFKEWPKGDITKIKSSEIPEHDMLAAGFPCQPFSIAGVSKKRSLDRPDGFDDPEQGDLFFEVKRIIKAKRPKAFLLENVKNLKTHDKGRTFEIINNELKSIGYDVHSDVLDAQLLVPQHRERLFIIGFDHEVEFEFPQIKDAKRKLNSILEKNPDRKYTLTKGVWNALKRHALHHKAKGNGFGYGIADPKGISRTLSARYYKDGGEILISQGRGRRPRRLTPKECSRLMGFGKEFVIDQVSDNQAYRQFGNSVVVPLVEKVARSMINYMYEKPLAANVR